MSYIAFNDLGSSANLGSQIQQYASMYAIAKKTNKTIVFPESQLKLGWGIKLQNIIDIPFRVEPDAFFENFQVLHPTDGLLVDTSVFNLDSDTNYLITNLLHLYHYWYPEYADDVYNWKWNSQHYQAALQKYESLKVGNKQTIGIHVRRGDYLNHDHFCKLDTDYYQAAIQPFINNIENYQFLIFSNDIEWCKANLIEGDMVSFVEPGIDYVDLITLSLCDHIVTANSSFSWWAAYRKKSRNNVTCPKNYIKDYSAFRFINENYYPEVWTSVDNNKH